MTKRNQAVRVGQWYRDALPGRSDIRTLRVEQVGQPSTDSNGRTRCAVVCTVVRKESAGGVVTTPMRTLTIDAARLSSKLFELVLEER
ncbi:hypothetical protein [Nocardia huaxiensis]|uniref:Uncharacterized protein n=1 Tax=Nocardia huaxiensis TaxID=2755382 RepID=A0A7D6ZM84_9NOCA|nr:hypothetical protein [Nocardia huaxiensis]QLY33987.1 hypothetical protein H0264_18685 [Nocardia huaxiensis]UFS99110.1 hypothetical protein LPY97_15025 [Nocardia huaxiensis]